MEITPEIHGTFLFDSCDNMVHKDIHQIKIYLFKMHYVCFGSKEHTIELEPPKLKQKYVRVEIRAPTIGAMKNSKTTCVLLTS